MARLLLLLWPLLLAAASAAPRKELPAYIKPCHTSDPAISECARKAILSLRPQLLAGMNEIDIPSIEPLVIPSLHIIPKGSSLQFSSANVRLFGAGQYQIPDLKVFLNETTLNLDFEIFIPSIRLETEYKASGSIFSLPIQGTGPLTVNVTGVTALLHLDGKLHARKSGTWLRFHDGSLKVKDVKTFKLQLENLFNGDKTLGGATNVALNENSDELLELVLPDVEKTILEFVLNSGNSVGAQFAWEQLAPK